MPFNNFGQFTTHKAAQNVISNSDHYNNFTTVKNDDEGFKKPIDLAAQSPKLIKSVPKMPAMENKTISKKNAPISQSNVFSKLMHGSVSATKFNKDSPKDIMGSKYPVIHQFNK